jgi:hypothetical protein
MLDDRSLRTITVGIRRQHAGVQMFVFGLTGRDA